MPLPKQTLKNRASLTVKNLLPIEQYQLVEEMRQRFRDSTYTIEEEDGAVTITLFTAQTHRAKDPIEP